MSLWPVHLFCLFHLVHVSMMAWSGEAWVVSVVAVVLSGVVAWSERNWRRRPGLDMGFVEHGGMWGDAVLLPIANAAIWPWVSPGWWVLAPGLVATTWSLGLHVWWHGGHVEGVGDHMWPHRPHAHWARDLSLAGWAHVAYVAAEITLLLVYALTPVPATTVLLVSVVLTLHVPIGLLQPAWFATERVFPPSIKATAIALALVWAVAAWKISA